jgi:hypothetical protein
LTGPGSILQVTRQTPRAIITSNDINRRVLNASAKKFIVNQLLWMSIYFGIAIAASMFFEFPVSLLVVLAIIIPLSLFRRGYFMGRMGQQAESFFGRFGGGSLFREHVLNYYCINCGTKHNTRSCPRCGSNMKRIGD